MKQTKALDEALDQSQSPDDQPTTSQSTNNIKALDEALDRSHTLQSDCEVH